MESIYLGLCSTQSQHPACRRNMASASIQHMLHLGWSIQRYSSLNQPQESTGVSQIQRSKRNWAGVGWEQRNWAGVGWEQRNWAGVGWEQRNWAGVGWEQRNWAGVGREQRNWAGVGREQRNWAGVGWECSVAAAAQGHPQYQLLSITSIKWQESSGSSSVPAAQYHLYKVTGKLRVILSTSCSVSPL